MTGVTRTSLLVVGAGPCGLAVGVAAREHGVGCVLLDRGPVVSALEKFPLHMTWFSTPELLELGDLPFVTRGEKATRGESLKYYRRVMTHFDLDVRPYENVRSVSVLPEGGFAVEATHASGDARRYRAEHVVIATGTFEQPNLLGVEGESLPKVTHYFREPHLYTGQDVLVVGGSNSAVESALACFRAGAAVTIVHRGEAFGSGVKPWILPDMHGRMKAGEIEVLWRHVVERIEPHRVLLRSADGETSSLANDFVLAMTGFHPDEDFLRATGVEIDPDTGTPLFDPATMETTTPGLYVAGVIAAGRDGNRIFIENGRRHGNRILAHVRSGVVDAVQGRG